MNFQELAKSEGNILENKELMKSLNKAKESSEIIAKSLGESIALQTSLDQVNKIISSWLTSFNQIYSIEGKRHVCSTSAKWKLFVFCHSRSLQAEQYVSLQFGLISSIVSKNPEEQKGLLINMTY